MFISLECFSAKDFKKDYNFKIAKIKFFFKFFLFLRTKTSQRGIKFLGKGWVFFGTYPALCHFNGGRIEVYTGSHQVFVTLIT